MTVPAYQAIKHDVVGLLKNWIWIWMIIRQGPWLGHHTD